MILVTGGSGLVGSHLLLELIRRGTVLPIRATTRRLSQEHLFRSIASHYPDIPPDAIDRIQWVQADMSNIESLESVMIGVTQVYHCAAAVSFDPRQNDIIHTTNVEGTAALVDLAIEHKVDSFCFVSSIAAIGGSGDIERNEEMDWDAGSRRSYYSQSKYLSEMEVWRGMAEGLPAIIVNPSVIIGPAAWGESSTAFFKRGRRGMRYYVPGGTGFVDVRDVARAMVALVHQGEWGQRYILNAENMSFKHFLQLVCRSMDATEPTVELPRFLAEIAWRAEWLRSKLTASAPRLTQNNVRTSYEHSLYSSEKLKKQLNFTYTPMNECIIDTAKILSKIYADSLRTSQ